MLRPSFCQRVIASLTTQLNGHGFTGVIEKGYSVSIHEIYTIAETGAVCGEADNTYIVIKVGGIWWISGKQAPPTPEQPEVPAEQTSTEVPAEAQPQ